MGTCFCEFECVQSSDCVGPRQLPRMRRNSFREGALPASLQQPGIHAACGLSYFFLSAARTPFEPLRRAANVLLPFLHARLDGCDLWQKGEKEEQRQEETAKTDRQRRNREENNNRDVAKTHGSCRVYLLPVLAPKPLNPLP